MIDDATAKRLDRSLNFLHEIIQGKNRSFSA